MGKFKSLLIFLVLISFSGFYGCSKDDSSLKKNVDYQTEFSSANVMIGRLDRTNLRGDQDLITVDDEISGESFSFSISPNGENQFSISFDIEGEEKEVELNILSFSGKECTVEAIYEGNRSVTRISSEYFENEGTLFTFHDVATNDSASRGVYIESWWDCVKRLSLDDNVSMLSGFASLLYPPTFAVVAGSAGIICLKISNRLQFHDNSHGTITQG